jgi:hypothetical protein
MDNDIIKTGCKNGFIYGGIIMSNVFFGIIALSVAAAASVFVYVMLEVRGAVKTAKDFLKTTEDILHPTLEELRKSLKSMRNVTDNATAITEDVRTFSISVREAGKDITHVSKIINSAVSTPFFCVSGLRAGIKAAAGVIIKGIISKKAKA